MYSKVKRVKQLINGGLNLLIILTWWTGCSQSGQQWIIIYYGLMKSVYVTYSLFCVVNREIVTLCVSKFFQVICSSRLEVSPFILVVEEFVQVASIGELIFSEVDLYLNSVIRGRYRYNIEVNDHCNKSDHPIDISPLCASKLKRPKQFSV